MRTAAQRSGTLLVGPPLHQPHGLCCASVRIRCFDAQCGRIAEVERDPVQRQGEPAAQGLRQTLLQRPKREKTAALFGRRKPAQPPPLRRGKKPLSYGQMVEIGAPLHINPDQADATRRTRPHGNSDKTIAMRNAEVETARLPLHVRDMGSAESIGCEPPLLGRQSRPLRQGKPQQCAGNDKVRPVAPEPIPLGTHSFIAIKIRMPSRHGQVGSARFLIANRAQRDSNLRTGPLLIRRASHRYCRIAAGRRVFPGRDILMPRHGWKKTRQSAFQRTPRQRSPTAHRRPAGNVRLKARSAHRERRSRCQNYPCGKPPCQD